MIDITKLRNIGIIAHIDAGKTTTTERVLFYSGASHKMGNVDDGNTITDFDPEESERGITIYSAAITCQWKETTINIIDTPGHVDFTAEVERSLRVLDGAVVVFSSVEGVQAQSETVWRQADKYHVPRMCFINKMDRLGANFERTLNQITERLRGNPVPVTIPIGEGPHEGERFSGIIDLLTMQALYFDAATQGSEIRYEAIPEDLLDTAQEYRNKLIEAVVELDEDVTASYLVTGDVTAEQLLPLIRKATISGDIQPTYAGSALSYIGVQPILDGVTNFLPSPLDLPPVKGTNPKKPEKEEIRKTDDSEPFSGLIFKIVAEPHADFYFVRVYSGVLKTGDRVFNPRTGKKEVVSQLWRVKADQREKIEADSCHAGDIVGVIGLKDCSTGDTICENHQPILLESIVFPEAVISMAVEPDSSAERKKLAETLAKLSKQDPTFTHMISEETGQTIINGMGELHLEVLKHRIERDFKLKVRVHKPRVSYRETVTKSVTAVGNFHRANGEQVQAAEVTIQIDPMPGSDTVQYEIKLKHDAIPSEMRKALEESLKMGSKSGGIVGYPLMNLKFTVTDVKFRQGETTELAISAATSMAIQEGLSKADIGLLEPIMKLEVVTPDEFLGNIQADLQTRQASIIAQEPRGHLTALIAEAPLAQMFGYSTQVRSLSQGRASYSMEPLKYGLAPKSVMEQMLS
jgi:elongation factor G